MQIIVFQSAPNKIWIVALREYWGKHLNEMRRDDWEYVLHPLYCVHDNKGLISNDKCYGTNAAFVLCGFIIFL